MRHSKKCFIWQIYIYSIKSEHGGCIYPKIKCAPGWGAFCSCGEAIVTICDERLGAGNVYYDIVTVYDSENCDNTKIEARSVK
jgi:hypothetical protein